MMERDATVPSPRTIPHWSAFAPRAFVLGPRRSGEVFAPDELAAIEQLSHSVGATLDALSSNTADSVSVLKEMLADRMDSLSAAIRDLPNAIAARFNAR